MPKLEYKVKKEMPIDEFLKMFLMDEDMSITLVREANAATGMLKSTIRIAFAPPDFESELNITIEA
jgi:hypothetical protein